ncbi:hypothetical protein EJD97_021276, partial [Solanum chilense]
AQTANDLQACGSCSPEPTSSVISTPSVVSSATTTLSVVRPAISTVRELDTPAANSRTLIWCASSSASEDLLAASISRRSFFRACTSSSARPYASWHALKGDVVKSLWWRIRPPTLCHQMARQKGPQTQAP